MKTFSQVVLCLGLVAFGAHAQDANNGDAGQSETNATVPPPTSWNEVERGPNHKLWQRETYSAGPDGQIVTNIHQYQQLATGLHYLQNGQWVESKELIEPYASGAIAQHGPSQVIFANNLNTEGSIDMQSIDGKRITSNILGLGYYDSSTGQAVLIAQIKDSYGVLTSSNQVLYSDAFDGVSADVQYSYKKSGMEQDVIIRAQLPPLPDGMNSDTTKLEVFTEFVNSPDATVTTDTDNSGVEVDEEISWGATQIGRGRAFDLSGQGVGGVSVQKKYVTIQGRKVLIEMVPLKAVAASLSHLPLQSSIPTKQPVFASSQDGIIPGKRKLGAKPKPIKLATTAPSAKGYVLDYATLNVGQTNFTFQGDMTYLVSGAVNLAGVTTLEGGTVIKIDTGTPSTINVLGTNVCQTGPYRPAIFTSANDGTVGETVPSNGVGLAGTVNFEIYDGVGWGVYYMEVLDQYYNGVYSQYGDGTGSFTAYTGQSYYVNFYDSSWDEIGDSFCFTCSDAYFQVNEDGSIVFYQNGGPLCPPVLSLANGGALHDLRFSNLGTAVSSTGNYSVTNAQFVNCLIALQTEGASFYAGNILMSGVGTGFYGQGFKGQVEQLTFDQGTHVTDDPSGTESGTIVTLTNCLLTAVGDYGVVPIATNHVANLSSGSGIYQPVGAASHYLATNSPWHNAGTLNISPSLLAELGQRTTYPPLVWPTNAIRVITNLVARAVRDNTGYPDYGYHYDSLDYAFVGSTLYTNLTIASNTAIAYVEDPGYGLSLNNGANLTFAGTATAPCWFVNDKLVMEGGNGNWTNSGSGGLIFYGNGSAPIPQVNADFTEFVALAGDVRPVSDGYIYAAGVGNFVNCEFYSGGLGQTWPSYYCTNCLFMRAGPYLWSSSSRTENFNFINCTFIGGTFSAGRQHSSLWQVKNTAFDGTLFSFGDNSSFRTNTSYTTFDYNAYNTNNPSYGKLEVVGSHDVMVTNYFWQSSWFGNYYLPTNSPLIDAGSTTADQLGLYHFTTQTNQMKETNSVVDIGYHYVATDAYGNPVDTTDDGMPDYLKDSNGDGIYDAGDIRDWLVGLYNGLSRTNGLQVFTPLK